MPPAMKTPVSTAFAAALLCGLVAHAEPLLKDVFTNDFLVGAALNPWHFSGASNTEVRIIEKHFNTITPENTLKWGNL